MECIFNKIEDIIKNKRYSMTYLIGYQDLKILKTFGFKIDEETYWNQSYLVKDFISFLKSHPMAKGKVYIMKNTKEIVFDNILYDGEASKETEEDFLRFIHQ
jgi:hypothetical protein